MTNILQVDVQGHTDDRGAADHNRDLSNRRAMSVVRYLTEHGVEAGRLARPRLRPRLPPAAGHAPAPPAPPTAACSL
jgi:OOP family OmpA-OmpF porin